MTDTPTDDSTDSTDTTTRQIALDGGDPADERTSAEVRRQTVDAVRGADAAFIVTAELPGPDGPHDPDEGVHVSVGQFVADGIDDDTSASLLLHLSTEAVENAPLRSSIMPTDDADEGLGQVLAALLGGPGADQPADDADDADPAPDGMFQ